MNRDLFCPRPFEQFYVTGEGDVHLCCPEWIDVPVGSLLVTDPEEIWDGPVAREVRESMLDGSFRHCTACPFLPGPAGCVYRGRGDADTGRVEVLTLAYDPTCNLRCGSCRTGAKTISPEGREVHGRLLRSRSFFARVDTICASGSGDPFAAESFWDLLGHLDPADFPHVRLSLQTNGLLFDEHHLERLRRLGWLVRLTDLSVSVDAATPETYREVRGGDFAVLRENLAAASRMPHLRLQLNFVVQEANFAEMRELVVLARILRACRVSFSALDNWGTYGQEDYLRRAVHLPGHPRHAELLDVLRSPELSDDGYVTLIRLPRVGGRWKEAP